MDARRSAKNFASTMIIRTFATSLNWNESPLMFTDRWAPRLDVPIASTTERSPRVKTYKSGANAPSHA